jgi:hypothetical protein
VPHVVVIHRQPDEAAEVAGRLRDRGIEARPYLSPGTRGFRGIRAEPPSAIVIDLRRMPSYGRALGGLLRENKSLRAIPLVFIAGDPKKTAEARRLLPDAVFAEWSDVPAAIERAIREAPAEPRAPRPSKRSVAQKLGITAETVLAKLNAPADFDMPCGRLTKRAGEAEVVMFWAKSEAALARELPRLAPFATKGRRVWLLWPKRTSGVATDLTMPKVRAVAVSEGLIDYKVCAVDATWSAMAVSKAR